jgi:hypothetical protein
MSAQLLATGLGGAKLRSVLQYGFKEAKPAALGVAVAYVSVSGYQHLQKLIDKYEVQHLRLVTDTRDGVTHPLALAQALEDGWDVRVVDTLPGTFHPKLYIGGAAFDEEAGMTDPSLILAGSANLSAAALYRNGECSYFSISPKLTTSAGRAWKECWAAGGPLTTTKLSEYEKYFAWRNRYRPPADMVALGVADEQVPSINGKPAPNLKPPPATQKALPNTAATTAWAGLQSFTGDYNLQLEFPRDAGMVLNRLLGSTSTGNTADFLCEDGETRSFIFRYYPDNGMFRLNIHNSTPGATWARTHRDGIAVVEADDDAFRFRIVEPGREMVDVIDRSLALGTWGRTPTRLYGWY